ncbi:MAG: PRC and DUF2382 domain-containing protein [Akkermansiaceae bacterium]
MKDLFDYDVYDRNDHKVGTVENIWASPDEEIGFIGISTGWLGLGKNHLIPADDITVDEEDHVVRVPYDEDLIKESPSFESAQELGERAESNTYAHYGLTGKHGWAEGKGYSESTGFSPGPEFTDEDTRYAKGFSDQDTGYAEGARGFTDQPTEGTLRDDETIEIPLAQEKVHVGKRDKEHGEVRLRKIVRTETINQPVELRHEDVVVERVSGGTVQPGDKAFVEDSITIPISEEEVVIDKTIESAGTVKARKVSETEQKTISEEVRKEDVEVERDDSRSPYK